MSESMKATIAELQRHLEDLEQQAIDTKRTINSLCRVLGDEPIYSEHELEDGVGAVGALVTDLKGDEYFNKPLASAVRMILETRRDNNLGPASAEEIYEALSKGGFEFDGRGEASQLRGLKISLSKNTSTFRKLPNGKVGLAEWYGVVKAARPRQNGAENGSAVQVAASESQEEVDSEAGEESEGAEKQPTQPR